jgi:hypothetical protein
LFNHPFGSGFRKPPVLYDAIYDAYSKGLRVPRNGPFAPLFHPNDAGKTRGFISFQRLKLQECHSPAATCCFAESNHNLITLS